MQPAEFGSCRLASCQVDPQTRNQLSDKVGQQQLTITLSPHLWRGQHCLPSSFPPHNSQVPPAFMCSQEREMCRRANYCKRHLNHLLGTYVRMLQGTFCHTHNTFEQMQIHHLTSPAGSDHHQIQYMDCELYYVFLGRADWHEAATAASKSSLDESAGNLQDNKWDLSQATFKIRIFVPTLFQ